ncbi:MAG: calcium-binding protein [Moorea sp. SIO4A3]|nr:calcium-binding protein [Moorena sp. SIO4A3]
MAELNQTVVESSNPKPQLRFNSEELGLKVKRFIEEDQRLRSQGSSFSPSTIPSTVTDTLTGGDGNDTLNGGDGNDLIDGKNGDDLLNGNAGNDAIAGVGGDDTVIGGSGNDTIYGEFPTTIINSQFIVIPSVMSSSPETEGQNYLDGGDGDDILGGGGKDDTLIGGNGDDSLHGGRVVEVGSVSFGVYNPYGSQRCCSASGNDFINGGDGNDTLDGAEEADTLIGESGHDLITGGYGNDSLTGGDGNDTLRGGSDSDILTGGEGADIFTFRLLFPTTGFTRPTVGSQLTGAPKPERGIDRIEDFNALEGDKIKIVGLGSTEVSLSQFQYNQNTGILSFENQQFAQLQAGADFIVDRDVILSISSY